MPFLTGQSQCCSRDCAEEQRDLWRIYQWKILDSAIIGVIAYIVLAIMKMPDTMLVAVIIGVTNIYSVFWTFYRAIPSFIIIVLQNPVQGLYFLIFVIIYSR